MVVLPLLESLLPSSPPGSPMELLIDSDIIEKVIDFLGFLPSVTVFTRLSKTTHKKGNPTISCA
jgi:hypothetical protein